MVMDISKYGVWFFYDGMTAVQSAEFARTVEKLGYGALWIPEAVGREPFAHAAYLAARTERLAFATGIANIYARDALTMAAAAATSRWSPACAAIATTSPTATCATTCPR